jgi:cellobiose phosphorylase
VARYQVEPYVVAADVYAEAPHQGRGGWTWYTGSASWMYRLVLESLLGLRRERDSLHFAPCLPAVWPGFALQYRFGETVYAIQVSRVAAETGTSSLVLDGVVQISGVLALHDDRQPHSVELYV